jgi:hypothetical protein
MNKQSTKIKEARQKYLHGTAPLVVIFFSHSSITQVVFFLSYRPSIKN